MPLSAWVMLIMMVVMFVVLFATRIPPAAVFLGVLTICLTFHLGPDAGLLAGFSNPGVLTVGVLFVVAAGMYSTGAVNRVIDQLIGLPRTLGEAMTKILPFVAGASAILNNTPLVAMMVPVVRDLSRTTGLPASKLYLPVSFASILGGASTLIGTSTNLIIAGMVAEQLALNDPTAPPMRTVTFLDPAFVGVPAAIVGLVFIVFVGSRLLPSRVSGGGERGALGRWYRVEMDVAADSPLTGKSLDSVGLASSSDYQLTEWRRGEDVVNDRVQTMLEARDRLTFTADVDGLGALWSRVGLMPSADLRFASAESSQRAERANDSLVEAVISRANPGIWAHGPGSTCRGRLRR